MEPKFIFEVNENRKEPITILQGKALDPVAPKKIKIKGDINSVRTFLEKRIGQDIEPLNPGLQAVQGERAVITVNREQMTICLELDPENPYGAEVTGTLEHTPELLQFGINSNKQYSREEFMKLLRFNRRFFLSDHEKLVKAYQTLQIKTSADLKVDSDLRGNKAMNFGKTVDSASIPDSFVLRLPIFKGFGTESFRVEICLEATDASVRFWLESVELAEIIEQRKDQIFENELEPFKSDFVIINQ